MITSAEFTDWAAFLAVEPDVGTRIDWNTAASVAATASCGSKIDGPLVKWGRG